MGNRRFLINQAILSSSVNKGKVNLSSRGGSAITDGALPPLSKEQVKTRNDHRYMSSVGSTMSFQRFKETCDGQSKQTPAAHMR